MELSSGFLKKFGFSVGFGAVAVKSDGCLSLSLSCISFREKAASRGWEAASFFIKLAD